MDNKTLLIAAAAGVALFYFAKKSGMISPSLNTLTPAQIQAQQYAAAHPGTANAATTIATVGAGLTLAQKVAQLFSAGNSSPASNSTSGIISAASGAGNLFASSASALPATIPDINSSWWNSSALSTTMTVQPDATPFNFVADTTPPADLTMSDTMTF